MVYQLQPASNIKVINNNISINATGSANKYALNIRFIPALKSIESVQWEPELPHLGESHHDDLMLAIHSNKLAQIGDGSAIRMLPVLDLEKIARAFRTQQLALT